VKFLISLLLLGMISIGSLGAAETLNQEGYGTAVNYNKAKAKTVEQSGTNILNAANVDRKYNNLKVQQVAEGDQVNVNLAEGKDITQDGTNVGNTLDMSKTSKNLNVVQGSDIKQRNINTATRTGNIIQNGTNVGNIAKVKAFKGMIQQGVTVQQTNINTAQGRTIQQSGLNVGNTAILK
jgi:hypothetical protein